jgi:repressor of nif and glnA expression
MSAIKAWEKIPKNKNNPDGPYITRLGASGWGVHPYTHGYVVGTIAKNKHSTFLENTMYASTINGIAFLMPRIQTRLYGVVAKGVDEALQDTKLANEIARDIVHKLKEMSDATEVNPG